MEISGKVHCLFEQSGTFKNEFIKLGINAEDYDIQNNFGQTDHIIDLFGEIDKEYDYQTRQDKTRQDKTRQDKTRQDKTRQDKTIFSSFDVCQDLVLAFFPCIYFESMSMMYFSCDTQNNKDKPMYERIEEAIIRLGQRTRFHELLYKLAYLSYKLGFKMIIENPATKPNYLIDTQNFMKPTIVDNNRMARGDYFRKPTAYWFFNFEPTHGFSEQNDKEQKTVLNSKQGMKAGVCSEERSLISPDYARNFICDFIIGKKQHLSQLEMEF